MQKSIYEHLYGNFTIQYQHGICSSSKSPAPRKVNFKKVFKTIRRYWRGRFISLRINNSVLECSEKSSRSTSQPEIQDQSNPSLNEVPQPFPIDEISYNSRNSRNNARKTPLVTFSTEENADTFRNAKMPRTDHASTLHLPGKLVWAKFHKSWWPGMYRNRQK